MRVSLVADDEENCSRFAEALTVLYSKKPCVQRYPGCSQRGAFLSQQHLFRLSFCYGRTVQRQRQTENTRGLEPRELYLFKLVQFFLFLIKCFILFELIIYQINFIFFYIKQDSLLFLILFSLIVICKLSVKQPIFRRVLA